MVRFTSGRGREEGRDSGGSGCVGGGGRKGGTQVGVGVWEEEGGRDSGGSGCVGGGGREGLRLSGCVGGGGREGLRWEWVCGRRREGGTQAEWVCGRRREEGRDSSGSGCVGTFFESGGETEVYLTRQEAWRHYISLVRVSGWTFIVHDVYTNLR